MKLKERSLYNLIVGGKNYGNANIDRLTSN